MLWRRVPRSPAAMTRLGESFEPYSWEPAIVHRLCSFLHHGTKGICIELAKSSNPKAPSALQAGKTISKCSRQLSSSLFNVYYRPSTLPSALHILSLTIVAIILWIGIIVISILKIRNFNLEKVRKWLKDTLLIRRKAKIQPAWDRETILLYTPLYPQYSTSTMEQMYIMCFERNGKKHEYAEERL